MCCISFGSSRNIFTYTPIYILLSLFSETTKRKFISHIKRTPIHSSMTLAACLLDSFAFILTSIYVISPIYSIITIPIGFTFFVDHNCNEKTVADLTYIEPYQAYKNRCSVKYTYAVASTIYTGSESIPCIQFILGAPTDRIRVCYGHFKHHKSERVRKHICSSSSIYKWVVCCPIFRHSIFCQLGPVLS